MNAICRVQDQLNTSEATVPHIIGQELNLRKLPCRQWESNPQHSEQLRSMTIKTCACTETATTAYRRHQSHPGHYKALKSISNELFYFWWHRIVAQWQDVRNAVGTKGSLCNDTQLSYIFCTAVRNVVGTKSSLCSDTQLRHLFCTIFVLLLALRAVCAMKPNWITSSAQLFVMLLARRVVCAVTSDGDTFSAWHFKRLSIPQQDYKFTSHSITSAGWCVIRPHKNGNWWFCMQWCDRIFN